MQEHANSLMLSRFADGELRTDELAALERHVAACPACRRQLMHFASLASELHDFYCAPVRPSAAAPAPVRPARRPSRLPRIAAAAAVAGILVGYPAVASEMRLPAASSGVAAQAIGTQSAISRRLPQPTKFEGFVVRQGQGAISVRAGAVVWTVTLPPGTAASNYPIGMAVTASGIPVHSDHLEALSVTPAQP